MRIDSVRRETHRVVFAVPPYCGCASCPRLVASVAGVDIPSVSVVVVSVTALGYVCALARARTGCLVPAITAHVAFNLGGSLAGIVYAIVFRLATGHLPTL